MTETNLMTWMASNRDPGFLDNVIKCLKSKQNLEVRKVFYLYTEANPEDPKYNPRSVEKVASKLDEVKKLLADQYKITLETIPIKITDPTEHDAIIKGIYNALKPRINKFQKLSINISSGTPAMRVVWLILKANGFFEAGTRFFDFQKAPPLVVRANPEDIKSGEWIKPFQNALEKGEIQEITASRVVSIDEQDVREIKFELDDSYHAAIQRYRLEHPEEASYDLDNNSKHLQQAIDNLQQYCKYSNMPILILGERGIGKSSSIQNLVTPCKGGKKLFSINCGTLNPNTAYPEIFGAVKGSYTGASSDRKGILEKAKGEVIFFDEIHHLSPEIQRTLLRTLQDDKHCYRRLGEIEEQYSEGTEFIFASNLPLRELQDKLDADFFDRISCFMVKFPSLRECPDKIEGHWNKVWERIADSYIKSGKIKKENVPIPYWNKLLKSFFKDENNLLGNFRSLEHVAHNILVRQAWQGNELKDILENLAENNKSHDLAAPKQRKTLSNNFIESEFSELTWKKANQKFRQLLAQWALNKYGSISEVANKLDCSPKRIGELTKVDNSEA